MNNKKISKLIEVLRSGEDEDARRQAADRLVKVARYNETAIAALVRLLLDFNRSRDSRREAAKIIGAIAYGNQIAIAALVELLDVSSDRDTRRVVADSLAKTVKGSKGKLEAIAALALRNDSMEQTEQTSCTIREKLPPTR